jgi:hypothetical protein
MPASSSPSSILVRSTRTSGSSVSSDGTTPARASAVRARSPQGTSSAHRPSRRAWWAKSSRPWTPAGFPAGTAICRRLRANTRGSPEARPPSTTRLMFEVFADAKTSAGAPSRIWARSEELPPRFRTTSTPGWAASNAASISAKASVSEAAADTSTSPWSPVPGVERPASGAPAPPQAAAVTASAAAPARRLEGILYDLRRGVGPGATRSRSGDVRSACQGCQACLRWPVDPRPAGCLPPDRATI